LRVPAEEGEAFDILCGRLDAGILILCDHAENVLPAHYGTLGLKQHELERHIAYDIGAAGVARGVAKALDAPAVLTRHSRLLIDCNRGLDDPTLIVRLSDGVIIPANRSLSAAEREERITRYYEPYHRAIDRLIDEAMASGIPPALLSIHSFTESWRGRARPWHAAVLWDKDPRLALRLIGALSVDQRLTVGDNEPYSGRLAGDCMWRHGTMRGLAHAIVEIRQDLVRDDRGQKEWALRLAAILGRVLAADGVECDLRRVQHYGSHAD
jgi:predicted N-formylglutamate amidohydrolase